MKQDTEIGRTDTKRDEAVRQRLDRALEKPTYFAGHRFIIIYCILETWGKLSRENLSCAISGGGKGVYRASPPTIIVAH